MRFGTSLYESRDGCVREFDLGVAGEEVSVAATNVPEVDSSAPPARAVRRRRALIVAVALIGLVAAGVVSWRIWSGRGVDGVQVSWVGEPVCRGTSLRHGHAIEWSRHMSCVVTVAVHNRGPATVKVTRAVLPYLGPGGGAVVRAASVDGRTPVADADEDVHAALALDHHVAPGATWTFPVRITYRPDGCTDAGTFWVRRWPTVEVTARGRDARILSDRTLTIHSSHQNPGCDMDR